MKTRFAIFQILLFVMTVSVNAQNCYTDPDLYKVINSLLRKEFKDVDLVVLDLEKVIKLSALFIDENGDSIQMESRPPPPPSIYAYSKELFQNIYKDRLIDLADVEYMFAEIENSKKYLLDSARINCSTIRHSFIINSIKEIGLDETYNYLLEQYDTRSFMKISSPIFSKNKDKLVISIGVYCGS